MQLTTFVNKRIFLIKNQTNKKQSLKNKVKETFQESIPPFIENFTD